MKFPKWLKEQVIIPALVVLVFPITLAIAGILAGLLYALLIIFFE